MIKHSIQLIEWLGGVGSTKSRVLADETQFDADVRLTYDLSNAPGLPMGPPTSACMRFRTLFQIGEVMNCSFAGPPGGAMLRRFRVAPSTISNPAVGADNEIVFNNFNIAGRVRLQILDAFNIGGRQFDERRASGAADNARLIIPFGSVGFLPDVALAAVPTAVGEDREARFMLDSEWHNANMYIPPGDTGWAMVVPFVLTGAADLIMDCEFELFPLRSTGMPK